MLLCISMRGWTLWASFELWWGWMGLCIRAMRLEVPSPLPPPSSSSPSPSSFPPCLHQLCGINKCRGEYRARDRLDYMWWSDVVLFHFKAVLSVMAIQTKALCKQALERFVFLTDVKGTVEEYVSNSLRWMGLKKERLGDVQCCCLIISCSS